MAEKKTIFIIDDHPMFREGLRSIISRNPRFAVVGEAGTAQRGLARVRSLRPDLAIVDISLPDKSGIQLTREIRSLPARHSGGDRQHAFQDRLHRRGLSGRRRGLRGQGIGVGPGCSKDWKPLPTGSIFWTVPFPGRWWKR